QLNAEAEILPMVMGQVPPATRGGSRVCAISNGAQWYCRAALHLWFHFWWLGCSFAIVAFCLLCIFACLPAKKNSLYRVRLLMLCIYNLVR
ncbi:hypothetical protein, partial [Pseudomonas aeruginosa]|uniref:hypothetical protein n=1 Tax=Pseudomonas aeruginosa TaxID=287 RepID=UPI0031B68AA5